MLAVINFGLGNLQSISGALEKLEIPHVLTSDLKEISDADGLILPGVGSFPDGIRNLRNLGLPDLLHDLVILQKRPVLGICLGYQLMAREGFEFERLEGLGWLDATVVRLEKTAADARIPHVGWNDVVRVQDSPIFDGIAESALFYFTHSYHLVCHDQRDIIAFSENGMKFVSAVQKGNIFGTQFHPEKSQQHGLDLLRNFSQKVVSGC